MLDSIVRGIRVLRRCQGKAPGECAHVENRSESARGDVEFAHASHSGIPGTSGNHRDGEGLRSQLLALCRVPLQFRLGQWTGTHGFSASAEARHVRRRAVYSTTAVES